MWRGSREIPSAFVSRPCQLLGGQARRAAMVGVFLVSAVVHEYIFCFVLGFFYPVMLILFLVIGGELTLCVPLGKFIQREEACAPSPGESRATYPRQKGVCDLCVRRDLGAGREAASAGNKGVS